MSTGTTMAFLKPTKGLEPGQMCELDNGSLVLGRNPKCCDVVLEHYAVSRKHARIEVSPGATFIEDMHSRNGVLVNGLPIQPGLAGRQRLYANDRIEIAAFEFIYEERESTDGIVVVSDEGETHPDILSTVKVSSDSSRIMPNRAGKLQAVLGIIEALAQPKEVEDILPKIVDTLLSSFRQAESAYLLLKNVETCEFEPAAVRRLENPEAPIRISRAVINEVVKHRQAVLSGDAVSDSRFVESASVRALRLRSMICAPLIGSEGGILGLIHLEVVRGQRRFTPDDLDVLAGVARHLAVVIENSRLHVAELRAQRAEFEQRFRKLIEGAVQGVLILRDWTPLYSNDAWAKLHGKSVEEIRALDSVLDLVHPEDREVWQQQAQLAEQDKPARFESRAIRADGTATWIENFASTVGWDGGPAIQVSAVDISARKKAEEVLRDANDKMEQAINARTAELAQSNRQLQIEIGDRVTAESELRKSVSLYHSLVDHIPLCVARKDIEGRFTFVNRALCELLGRTEAELIGQTDHSLFDKELANKYRGDDIRIAETGEVLELVETIDLTDRSTIVVQTLKSPIRDVEDNVVGMQLIFWDVTAERQAQEERKRYAEELERSNRDLEQFAHSVSHDLQSPLRTIATYCELLHQDYAKQLEREAVEFLEAVIDGTERMRRLVEDLLAYSKVSTAAQQLELCDCRESLQQALKNLSSLIEEQQAEIKVEQLPEIVCDSTQLMQLFQNLLGNAIRYRGEATPKIAVSCQEVDHGWEFAVTDNGVGVEPRNEQRIFEIFQRATDGQETPGSGIGLSICKRIVERHGGDIWLKSKPGSGTTFYFRLPKKVTATS